MANAVAKKLNKKILLVNVSVSTDSMELKEYLRMIFREGKIQNAIIFFDECESLFESRANRYSPVANLLTQIENYDDITILATNRHYDIDEVRVIFEYYLFSIYSYFSKFWRNIHKLKIN